MSKFTHLHVHTQFSLLDGAADIKQLYKKAITDGQPALAMTDHGNMFGAFEFVAEAYKHKVNPDDKNDKRLKVKPIVGCEFYLVENRHKRQFTREEKDVRYHQVLLAKNEVGYRNLVKLCSLGYIEGLYGKYPRIDKELIEKYHEGLIATTCCLGASVPKAILKKGEEEGEKEFKWWYNIFGEDYYIEFQRHGIPEQDKLNEVLKKLAAKYNVKTIATNDSHYVDITDYNAHDILLCINTGEKKSTPIVKEYLDDEDSSGKNKRFAFYNDQFYFKTTEEMSRLFADMPEAIDYTNEIVDKVELLDLKRDILLPNFPIPPEFLTQDQYLRHLTFEGAKRKYGEVSPEVEERLNFELQTIETMGFAGYFLIVMDFIKAGRNLGVFIGPGRGSAAGSAVAYCIDITNIDPIKYNLLFERFLNPDRKSMPDIDTDMDDEGRQKVLDYVVEKYGKNQVAQIITYGTMAAKMSIKDVARVLDLPLNESNELAKLVPDTPGIKLDRIFEAPLDGEKSLREKEGLNSDDIVNVKQLREIIKGNDLRAEVLREARVLEGSVRNTGVHACGIIIAPKDLSELIPLSTAKDSDLLVTQYEGKVIEDAGVIKMDFLGLKTLSIIKGALELIDQNHQVKIDIDKIPLDDPKTFELYQRGETNATFQFESPGMQKYLRELRPDKFDDLIAMNALYRPGPLEYIPNFIARKHGREVVAYDLPEMEEYLKDTYGITVYQEQVMLLSQKLAGFTKGDADTLRKAMGKKQIAVLDKMKSKFMDGCQKKGYDLKICEKIWTDWEAFASYAFNKSHSTCYAFVAFQTAYLKAHYPAEYMASVLNNANSIEKITFFMDECKRMGIQVLCPDVNESNYAFTVNKKGNIRFGLGSIKGAGEAAVNAIVEERKKNGPFQSIFDFVERIPLSSVNKKNFEAFALSGAFDCFCEIRRSQFFVEDINKVPFIELLIRYGSKFQMDKSTVQNSLFGGGNFVGVTKPDIPQAEDWSNLEKLKREKELVGIYLSAHPLDQFRLEIDQFCSHSLADLSDLSSLNGKDISFAGMVTEVRTGETKNGKPYGAVTIEDYTASYKLMFFGDNWVKNSNYYQRDYALYFKAKVQPRPFGNAELEVNIKNVTMLSNVRDEMVKSISIVVPVQLITDELIVELKSHADNTKGKVELKFKLIDKSENMSVDLYSRTMRINLTEELISYLRNREEIEFRLN
ncbi:MAG TPA: DNA polymerase III subunit alpha [Bacteroidales bacterium]